MYPHERSLVRVLAGKPFAIIGVNSDSDVSTPQALTENGTVTWRSFQNEEGDTRISENWGIVGWPTIILIDQDGVIRHINVRGEKIDTAIKEMLEAMGEEWPDIDMAEEIAKENKNDAKDQEQDDESSDEKSDK